MPSKTENDFLRKIYIEQKFQKCDIIKEQYGHFEISSIYSNLKIPPCNVLERNVINVPKTIRILFKSCQINVKNVQRGALLSTIFY